MALDASQQAVVDDTRYPYFCLAPAGSGKSTSLLEKAKKLALSDGRDGKVLILAFNKAIQVELQEKLERQGLLPLGIEVKTLHGFCLSSVLEALKPGRLNYLSTSANKDLYFGIKKPKHLRFGGLLEQVVEACGGHHLNEVTATAVFKKMQVELYKARETMAAGGDGIKRREGLVNHVIEILHKTTDKLQKFEKSKRFAEEFIDVYIDSYFEKPGKLPDFYYYFVRNFYYQYFVDFCHNAVIENCFKHEMFGKFADEKLDSLPVSPPIFYKYFDENYEVAPRTPAQEGDELSLEILIPSKDYRYYSECLKPQFGSIAAAAFVRQVSEGKTIDFDIMLSLGAYCLKKQRAKYHAVLVDEAQDLSIFDWFMSLHVFPTTIIKDKEPRLFYVGDFSQAINRWRGASAERFIFNASTTHTGSLKFSYRCPDNIVKHALTIRQNSHNEKAKTEMFSSAAPERNQPGVYDRAPDELEDLYKNLAEAGYHLPQIAVLGRTNADVLPFRIYALLTDQPVSELYINKWKIDDKSLKCLLCLIALSSTVTSNHGLAADTLNHLMREPDCADRFMQFVVEVRSTTKAIMRFFNYILDEEEEFEISDEAKKEMQMASTSISRLQKWYGENRLNLCSEFKRYLTKNYQTELSRSGLSLSTIHRFKGKEKDVVVITSSSWPSILVKRGDWEEEVALSYVALTRAKKAAYLHGNLVFLPEPEEKVFDKKTGTEQHSLEPIPENIDAV